MTYFDDVYKKRGAWWGQTQKEQYTNIAIKYFEDYLLNSPDADGIILNGVNIQAAVRDNQDDENKLTKYFLIGLDYTVVVGDLIFWYDDYWLVLSKEKRSFEAYNKILAVRCNYSLKWVDDYGVLNTSPCYLFSSMSSKIQDNFKSANAILVPQSNKFLEIILPYKPIANGQRFIIRSEAWRAVERDLVSVNGVLYISLVEEPLDNFDDNKVLGIADYNKLNSSYIDLGLTSLTLVAGESFTFGPILYQDKKLIEDVDFTYSLSSNIALISNGTLVGVTNGSATLTVSMTEQPELVATCVITIVASGETSTAVQLVGDDSIKCGRTRTYTVLENTQEVNATFTLINNTDNLVSFHSATSTSCTLIANSSGATGTVTLRATTTDAVVDKVISIVSVW